MGSKSSKMARLRRLGRWLALSAVCAVAAGCSAMTAQNPGGSLQPVNAVPDGADASVMLKGHDVVAFFTDAKHMPGLPAQRARQDAAARTDLQDCLLRLQRSRRDDFSDDILVDQEMLAEAFLRRRSGAHTLGQRQTFDQGTETGAIELEFRRPLRLAEGRQGAADRSPFA